jgi:hypothetical protein
MKKFKKYKDMSMKHEGIESKSMEGRETMLEKRGYAETKSGKMRPMKAKEGVMAKVSPKADLDNDGSLSSYEKKRGMVIQNAMSEEPVKAQKGKMMVKGQKAIQVNKQYFGEY